MKIPPPVLDGGLYIGLEFLQDGGETFLLCYKLAN